MAYSEYTKIKAEFDAKSLADAENRIKTLTDTPITVPTFSLKTAVIVLGLIIGVAVTGFILSRSIDGVESWFSNHKIAKDEKPIAVDDKSSVDAETDANVALTDANTSDQQIQAREPRISHLQNEITKQNRQVNAAVADRNRVANTPGRGDVKITDLDRKLDQITNRGDSNR